MGSKRLPGKILADVAGMPMLELIVRRVRGARSLSTLIVATTVLAQDDPVEELCTRLGVPCHRGSVDDCLDRIYMAVVEGQPSAIVRLTGDNPAPNGDFVDWVVDGFHTAPPCDYADTMSDGTFPYGLSVEVLSFDALAAAWREAREPEEREHVTQFVRLRPGRFALRPLGSDRDDHAIRLTVDYQEDLDRMNRVFKAAGKWDVGWRELVELARADQR
jgi:spore coat polysaccharide biosynthesis protein SpsF (cytidylyltransferase family)